VHVTRLPHMQSMVGSNKASSIQRRARHERDLLTNSRAQSRAIANATENFAENSFSHSSAFFETMMVASQFEVECFLIAVALDDDDEMER
jgi:hypothetical protein